MIRGLIIILKKQLRQKNWLDKYDIYQQFFEGIENISGNSGKYDISVVVISWRLHPDTLKNFMILKEQSRNINFELIFVNNGGGCDEFQILLPYIDKYITLSENTGAYLARNIGALFADSSLLLFLEDDGIPDEKLLLSHYLTHHKYNVISVQGPYLYKTDNLLNEYQHHYYHGEDFFPKYSDLEGNSSYLADAFFKVGGWDDNIKFGGGGIELSIRLSKIYPEQYYQIYSPICILMHDYVVSPEHLATKREKQLNSLTQLQIKHPEWNDYIATWLERSNNKKLLQIRNHWTQEDENIFQDLVSEVINKYQYKTSMCLQERIFLSNKDHIIEHIKTRSAEYQIVIFGVGGLGQKVYKLFSELDYKNIIFVDNNQDMWGKEINSVKVLSPENLSTTNHFVYIASSWGEEISAQLREKGFVVGSNYSYVII